MRVQDDIDTPTPAPVTVIIPCYRCSNTIDRAVASVAAQTWRPAELTMVGELSDDEAPGYLHTLQSRYGGDWIEIILRQENCGPGAARNSGWNAATQPYIAFLDADDAWHPRKIELQLKYMQAHPDVTITSHRSRWLREREKPLPLPEHYTIKPVTLWKMLVSNRSSTSTVMLKRDLGFRFEPTKRHSEDYLLWLRILYSGYKATFIDLDLAYIYKAPYGAGGLSGQLWSMEKGELDTYRKLRDEMLISWSAFLVLSIFSMAKYVRRVMISKLRGIRYEA